MSETRDLLTIRTSEYAVEITAGEMSAFRSKELLRRGARVFRDGKMHSASLVGEGPETVLFGQALEAPGIPVAYELPSGNTYGAEFRSPVVLSMETLQEKTEALLERLRAEAPEFLFSGKTLASCAEKTLTNSKGVNLRVAADEWEAGILFKHRRSANIFDGHFDASGTGTDWDLGAVLAAELPFLQAFPNEVALPEGIRAVAFPSPGMLFGKLCESLMIDKYESGAAIYSGKLGEKVLNERFSLHDVTLDPAKGIISPFDGEGTRREHERLTLIENGVLKNVICDLRYGAKYGRQSSQNGKRGFDTGVSLGFNGLVIGTGNRSYLEVAKSVGECVYVAMAGGGGFTDSGDYSTPVQLAYLVRDGKPVGRLPQLTLKSSVQEMFGPKLIEVSSDAYRPNAANPFLFAEMEVIAN